MSDPICQLMEDIEGLCKRCYHLQKSNNEMYGTNEDFSLDDNHCSMILDYLKEDPQMQEYINENEKIIEKYHRKLDEIFQLIRETQQGEGEIHWSPIAMDFKRQENAEKLQCDEKKKQLANATGKPTPSSNGSDDQGVYL